MDEILNNPEIVRLWDWFSNLITVETFIKLCVLYFFIIWISSIIWVLKDSSNRSDSLILQFISFLLSLIPFGIFLYLLIRPTKTLFERYYEEVEVNLEHLAHTIEGKLEIKEQVSIQCPNCNYPIENTYKFCPNCKEELKHACKTCDKKVSKDWKACPYCWENEPVENVSADDEEENHLTVEDKPTLENNNSKANINIEQELTAKEKTEGKNTEPQPLVKEVKLSKKAQKKAERKARKKK